MVSCPVCGEKYEKEDFNSLATHFNRFIDRNEPSHIDWARSSVPLADYDTPAFAEKLKAFFTVNKDTIQDWFWKRIIDKFYKDKAIPFIQEMQRPKKATFMGYAMENYSYARQRIKSLAYIIAKTDKDDVQAFEGKMLTGDLVYNGKSSKSNISLLINMAESVGLPEETLVTSMPLPPTLHSIKLWNTIAETGHWLEIMGSTNLLDLMHSPKLTEKGSKLYFFGNGVIDNEWIPGEVKEYLKFTRDVIGKYAEEGLELVSKYALELNVVEEVQVAFLRSLDAFDRHLQARMTRAKQFEAK